jgi:CubicO group peptidase (beta-lactamase class C family)
MLPERIDRVRDLCAGWVKSGQTTALSVCVARRGVIVLEEAFGRLRPEEDAPALDPTAVWPIFSASKPITAALVMLLVEDGVLGLNRPAKDYLPELSGEHTDEILVHHLLTHTAGYVFHTEPPLVGHILQRIADGFEPPTPCPDTQHPLLHQLLSILWDAPLVCRPGEQMIYSNHNYELLGELVRRVAGRSVEDFARERLFGPLGMNDTWYVVPESASPRLVHRPPEAPFAAPESPFMQGIESRQMQETPYAGAGVFATVRDMAVFGQTFLNGGSYGDIGILSPAGVAAMTHDQIPGVAANFFGREITPASWGYGWTVESPAKWRYFHGSLSSLGTFSHSGGSGFKLLIDPQRELVTVYVEACLRSNLYSGELYWNVDLFENAVSAAVED